MPTTQAARNPFSRLPAPLCDPTAPRGRPGSAPAASEGRPLDMIKRHDTFPFVSESTLTERGQISVPASLRKAMKLHPGQRLSFERISNQEFRVVVRHDAPAGPLAMLG